MISYVPYLSLSPIFSRQFNTTNDSNFAATHHKSPQIQLKTSWQSYCEPIMVVYDCDWTSSMSYRFLQLSQCSRKCSESSPTHPNQLQSTQIELPWPPNSRIFVSNQLKSSLNRHQCLEMIQYSSQIGPNSSQIVASCLVHPQIASHLSQFVLNAFESPQQSPKTRLKLVTIAMKASNSSSNRRKEANDPPTCK